MKITLSKKQAEVVITQRLFTAHPFVAFQCKDQGEGFTLLELLLVLMLISLITGLVTPKLGGSLIGVQTKTAVKKTSAILRFARNLAVTDQKARIVNFNTKTNTIALHLDQDFDVVEGVTQRIEPGGKYKSQYYQLPDNVIIQEVIDGRGISSDDELFTIFFYPAGNSSGGEIVLGGNRKGTYRIRVDFITGLVDVSN